MSDTPSPRPSLPRQLIESHKGEWKAMIVSLVCSIAQVALTIGNVSVVRSVIDHASRSAWRAVGVAATVFGLAVGAVVAQEASRSVGIAAGERVARRIRRRMGDRLSTLEAKEVLAVDMRERHAQLVHAAIAVDTLSLSLLGSFLPSVVIVAGVSTYLLFVSPWLLVALALAGAVAHFTGRGFRDRVVSQANAFGRSRAAFSGGVLDAFRLRDLISGQSAWPAMRQRLHALGDDVGTQSAGLQRAQARFTSLQQFVIGLATAIAVAIGGLLAARGEMTHGELVAFIVALGFMQSSVRAATSSFPALVSGREELALVLDFIGPTTNTPAETQRSSATPTRWEVRHVSFSYGEHEVLRDINLTLEPGSFVGLTGPNGSGKTTLVALLLGWYEPVSGAVLVDGTDLRTLDAAVVRRSIGLVQQDPLFLDATIKENLEFGLDFHLDDKAASARLRDALDRSSAASFIDKLTLGLDTRIGSAGVQLSGGERQRLAVARALIRRPRLLLIDEPTNHLDRRTAAQMLQNLRRSGDDSPAVLIVSHDPDVLAGCDVVYHLDDGRLNEAERDA